MYRKSPETLNMNRSEKRILKNKKINLGVCGE
jgi:hypothetical protein